MHMYKCKNPKVWSTVWIKHKTKHTDISSQGYVTVTANVEETINDVKSLKTNPHMNNAVLKYGLDNLEVVTIKSDVSKIAADKLDKTLRPTEQIGWNIE